jgi:hypothetical protein
VTVTAHDFSLRFEAEGTFVNVYYDNSVMKLTVNVFSVISTIDNDETMATPGQLIGAAAAATGMNRSTVENLYNHLRDEGVIPRGARGKNAVRVTSEHAAKLLIAMCGSEHVKDAVGAVRRYSQLSADTVQTWARNRQFVAPMGEGTWRKAARAFPRLALLHTTHGFLDALVSLIESYIDAAPEASVEVSLRGPYPWAGVRITIRKDKEVGSPVLISYSDGGDGDGPGGIAEIDPTKERQRRKFLTLGGDLNTTAMISEKTLAAFGRLLRDD